MNSTKCWAWWVTIVAALVAAGEAFCQQNPRGRLPTTSFDEPFLLLLHDPVVHRELGLTEQQQTALQSLTDELDLSMWSARNQPAEKFAEAMQRLTASGRERSKTILSFTQQKRLEQIRYWTRGMKFLLEEHVVEKVGLSGDQQNEIRDILDEMAQKFDALRKQVGSNKPTEEQQAEWQKLTLDQHQQIAAVLSREQLGRVKSLVAEPIDLAKLGEVKFKPPDFAGPGPWLNSPPRKLEDLRGKVVAVHFYAFGCINCVRNQPWYRAWHADFAKQGLVVIGIHTPETSREREVDGVRAAAKETGLTFPILIDNDKQMWNAWGNSLWPSTYLIDKHGYVRGWWYGELNWEGQDGEQQMRQRIEELLAEM